jgi:AcrR family transcriptional regulator
MARNDWLIGGDRRGEAAERIYAAATDLVSRTGFENFSIEALAAVVHCAPATIYRNAGGKKAILEAVAMRMSARIVEAVRAAMENLQGTDRVVTAIEVALARIRAEPLGPLIMGSIRPNHDGEWLTDSPGVAELAEEVIGRVDPLAAQWLIRVTLALWYWPLKDRVVEYEMLQRFVGPSSFLKSA